MAQSFWAFENQNLSLLTLLLTSLGTSAADHLAQFDMSRIEQLKQMLEDAKKKYGVK